MLGVHPDNIGKDAKRNQDPWLATAGAHAGAAQHATRSVQRVACNVQQTARKHATRKQQLAACTIVGCNAQLSTDSAQLSAWHATMQMQNATRSRHDGVGQSCNSRGDNMLQPSRSMLSDPGPHTGYTAPLQHAGCNLRPAPLQHATCSSAARSIEAPSSPPTGAACRSQAADAMPRAALACPSEGTRGALTEGYSLTFAVQPSSPAGRSASASSQACRSGAPQSTPKPLKPSVSTLRVLWRVLRGPSRTPSPFPALAPKAFVLLAMQGRGSIGSSGTDNQE